MDKIKCKECGKELNKKAEICPHCGCRVKSNTLKFVIICLIVIAILIGGYFGCKYIKHHIDENKKLEAEKIEKERIEKLNKKETKLFESYLGNYKLSYNSNLIASDFIDFKFIDEISINKKCQSPPEGVVLTNIEIDKDCIVAVDFETISESPGLYSWWYYIYKTSENSSVLSFQFQNIARTDGYSKIIFNRICFKNEDENNLIQTDCPTRKNGYSSYEATESIDLKYGFKLTKIK